MPRTSRHARAVFTAAAVLLLAGCRGCGDARTTRIVLVTIDTLRADHLGCYGSARASTPTLDALAREGILYEDATSVAPITLVSHATILTGLIPPAHGVRTNGSFRLSPAVTTLTERLKARGFATGAFVGSFVLSHEFGLDQGFDVYDDTLPRKTKDRKFDFAERRAGEVLSKAGDWAIAHEDGPFFLWAHVYDPHAPYDPPEPFAARFADSRYDGEIAYVDSELGKFFDRLRSAGILDETLVVVTSDHGEGLGEHGESTHGLFLYQGTLHVPLIVRPPGGRSPGVRVGRTVGIVDVAPTILSAAGVTAGQTGGDPDASRPGAPLLEGRVLPEVAGQAPGGSKAMKSDEGGEDGVAHAPSGASSESPTRTVMGRVFYFENLLPHYSFGWAGLRGVRSDSWKLIRSGHTELYDLSLDSAERTDVHVESPGPAGDPGSGVAATLAKVLDDVTARADARAPSASSDNPGLSAEARERLLALGYVTPGVVRAGPIESGPDPREMLPFFDGIEKAKDLLRAGRGDEGIAILRGLDARGPASVSVLNLLGQALMEQARWDDAMVVLERARTLDPGDYEVRRRLAEGHYARKEYQAAVDEAREALRLNDRNAESRSILGAALARLGRQDEAIASFREAIAQRPDEGALHYNLGFALEGAGRRPEAMAEYSRAAVLDPESTAPRLALGRLLLAGGDAKSARAQLEAAVGASPDDADALEQLGIALARTGDAAGALARFDRALAVDPVRVQLHFNRGLVLESLGRRPEAADAFRRFLDLWKGDPAAGETAREHLRRVS